MRNITDIPLDITQVKTTLLRENGGDSVTGLSHLRVVSPSSTAQASRAYFGSKKRKNEVFDTLAVSVCHLRFVTWVTPWFRGISRRREGARATWWLKSRISVYHLFPHFFGLINFKNSAVHRPVFTFQKVSEIILRLNHQHYMAKLYDWQTFLVINPGRIQRGDKDVRLL